MIENMMIIMILCDGMRRGKPLKIQDKKNSVG